MIKKFNKLIALIDVKILLKNKNVLIRFLEYFKATRITII